MIQRLLFNNFRLVYGFSRLLRSKLTSNGLLVLTALIMAGVFGFDTRQTLSFQIFSVLLSVLLLSLLCSFWFRRRFTVRRYLPEFATAGQPLKYELLIDNHTGSAQAGLSIHDELEGKLPSFDEFRNARDPLDSKRNWFDRYIGYPRLMNLVQRRRGGFIQAGQDFSVQAGETCRVASTLVPVQRGYLNFSNIRLMKPDPFGLVNSVRNFPVRDKLLVFPRFVNLGNIVLPGSRKYQPQGRAMANAVGESEEFLSLREYRNGDPLKKIHWKSFARFNSPVIKEYHDEYCVRQGLILDTCSLDGDDSLFEDAVSAATSFAMSCIQQDSILDLMFAGDKTYRFNAGRGSLTLQNMLEILACVQPSRENNLQSLERLAVDCISECSVYICVLLDWDRQRKEMIRTLRRYGMTILCVVIVTGPEQDDADLEPMLGTPEYFYQVRQTDFEHDLLQISL
ncbi:MAG: DUF58 domain-containing protein, partial [Gammaproteobacteria bacterium]|nr:DUF58 domain-containing protein [Gammaproteobacteria bacterium]